MAAFIAKLSFPKTYGTVFSMCARTARVGGVIGTTCFLGTNLFKEPMFPKTYCQGKGPNKIVSETAGGVAPRYQFTQADPSLRISRAPLDFQQLSSGSILGIITGYLTVKIGRLFLLSFGGIFLLVAVRLSIRRLKAVSSVSRIYSFSLAFVNADFTS
jgi:hypothetical protein